MADFGEGPSRTALLTAVARDLHRDEPPPWILDDDLALAVAGDEGRALKERLPAEVPGPVLFAFSRWVCARARFTEDLVEREAEDGVDQYVILGAGLDTYAQRRNVPHAPMTVFEVDHPATQSWKRQRLDELHLGDTPELVFAAVDFERQTLRAGLEAAGFEFDRRAVFAWIGVTMYLSHDAIDATLTTLAHAAVGSRLVTTYNEPDSALDQRSREVTTTMRSITARWGEPFISFFLKDEIDSLLRRHGFDDIVHFGCEDARASYFGERQDLEIAGAQALVSARLARRP